MTTSDFRSASELRCAACDGRVILAMVAVCPATGFLDALALVSFCRGSFMRFACVDAPRFEIDIAAEREPWKVSGCTQSRLVLSHLGLVKSDYSVVIFILHGDALEAGLQRLHIHLGEYMELADEKCNERGLKVTKWRL